MIVATTLIATSGGLMAAYRARDAPMQVAIAVGSPGIGLCADAGYALPGIDL